MKLNGIGAKIADCVCLFSLDKTEAVPVDTHVWQLAKDLYFPEWETRKSLTELAYRTVAGASASASATLQATPRTTSSTTTSPTTGAAVRC